MADYYQTLGVSRSASEKEIRQAYRKLARQYHPDVNPGDAKAEARFKEINRAHEVLSDPEKRRRYDRFGENWDKVPSGAEATAGGFRRGAGRGTGAGQDTFINFDAGNFDFGDLLGGIFGGSATRTRSTRPRRGADSELAIELTLEEAATGTTRLLQLTDEVPCPTCQGRGIANNNVCSNCGGEGVIRRPRQVEATMPPGVDTGSRVRLSGLGAMGTGAGQRGDLYLLISVRPHPIFQRESDNLRTQVSVPLTTAILGGEVRVPTLKGQVALTIPPETQNGRVFRLAGLGMPKRSDPSQRGDLYAVVSIVLPERLSEQERGLFKQLQELRPGA